jgi:N,N'-diacetyllegionaminate synthase
MTYIIADIGVNHGGDIDTAMSLIADLKGSADAVKLQLWRKGRWDDIEKLRLDEEEISYLFYHTKRYVGMDIFATAFDIESIDYLYDMGQNTWKVPSGLNTNAEYLERLDMLSNEGWKVILSTGLIDRAEIKTLLNNFCEVPLSNISVLHCVTSYPTKYEDVNLRVLQSMYPHGEKVFDGLSDHTPGIEAAVAAVALGATVIEKHVTFNPNAAGPDHSSSITPEEFERMVKMIRNIEKAMGDGVKKPTESELEIRDAIRERMKL